MAFWDFMSEPVGGAVEPLGVSEQPSLGSWQGGDYGSSLAPTEPAIAKSPIKQMTWAELLKSLMSVSGGYPQYNAGQMAGPQMLGGQPQGGIYPIGPTADFNQPTKNQETTDIMEVAQIASLFAGGV